MRTEDRKVSVSEPSISEPLNVGGDPVVQASKALAPPAYRYILFACIAASGIAWDLWSKWAMFDWLPPTTEHQVWKGSVLGMSVDFHFVTTFNRGALWGIGQNQTWLFALLSFLAIGGIAYFLWTKQAVATLWLTIASALLLAGASGNLYDRLGLHGWTDRIGPVFAVRDFLDFVFFQSFHWATFNFADTYLVTGAIMLVVYSFLTPVEESASRPAT